MRKTAKKLTWPLSAGMEALAHQKSAFSRRTGWMSMPRGTMVWKPGSMATAKSGTAYSGLMSDWLPIWRQTWKEPTSAGLSNSSWTPELTRVPTWLWWEFWTMYWAWLVKASWMESGGGWAGTARLERGISETVTDTQEEMMLVEKKSMRAEGVTTARSSKKQGREME